MLNKNDAPTIPARTAPFFHSEAGSRATPELLPDDSDDADDSDSDELPEAAPPLPDCDAEAEADEPLPEEAAAEPRPDDSAPDDVAEACDDPLLEPEAEPEAASEPDAEASSAVSAVSVAALSEALPPNCDLALEAPSVPNDLASEANWMAPRVTWVAKLVPKLTAPEVTSW